MNVVKVYGLLIGLPLLHVLSAHGANGTLQLRFTPKSQSITFGSPVFGMLEAKSLTPQRQRVTGLQVFLMEESGHHRELGQFTQPVNRMTLGNGWRRISGNYPVQLDRTLIYLLPVSEWDRPLAAWGGGRKTGHEVRFLPPGSYTLALGAKGVVLSDPFNITIVERSKGQDAVWRELDKALYMRLALMYDHPQKENVLEEPSLLDLDFEAALKFIQEHPDSPESWPLRAAIGHKALIVAEKGKRLKHPIFGNPSNWSENFKNAYEIKDLFEPRYEHKKKSDEEPFISDEEMTNIVRIRDQKCSLVSVDLSSSSKFFPSVLTWNSLDPELGNFSDTEKRILKNQLMGSTSLHGNEKTVKIRLLNGHTYDIQLTSGSNSQSTLWEKRLAVPNDGLSGIRMLIGE